MKRALFLTVGLLVALSPVQVEAQLYGGSITGGSAYLDFVSGSGVNGGYGVQVGPYTGNLQGDGFGNFSIYCVDYLHYASSGNVFVSQMSGDLSSTRLAQTETQAQAQVIYQKTAYLSSLFETTATSAWGGIHAAIWELSSGQSLGDGTAREMYVDMANANYASVDLSEWYVITPDGATDGFMEGLGTGTYDGLGQEFLMRRSVPEPATVLLMLTGLVLLVGVNRKRLLALQDL